MNKDIHTFDNGIKVYRKHLIPSQIDRYHTIRNVHEANEEDLFVGILKSSPSINCFVNIGCAIGYYPLLAKKILPSLTIHAYEPLGIFRKYFRENILLNGFSLEEFNIHEDSISSKNGLTLFIENNFSSKLVNSRQKKRVVKLISQGVLKYISTKLSIKNALPTVSVMKSITLDMVVKRIGKAIDFLQMDVQGHEVDVLKGGAASLETNAIKTILIGTHGINLHSECVRLLKFYNYDIQLDEQNTKRQPDGILLASKSLNNNVFVKEKGLV